MILQNPTVYSGATTTPISAVEIRDTSYHGYGLVPPGPGYRIGAIQINNDHDQALEVWLDISEHGNAGQALYDKSSGVGSGADLILIAADTAGAGTTNAPVPVLAHLHGVTIGLDLHASTAPTSGDVTVTVYWTTA